MDKGSNKIKRGKMVMEMMERELTEKVNKIIELLLFQHKLNNASATTIQYWCKKCKYEYPRESNFICPKCGCTELDGTVVARPGLFKDRVKLDKMYKELKSKKTILNDMNDKWNLKDKKQLLSTDDEEIDWENFYKEEDIETLRKKLIEDMETMANGGGDLFYIDAQKMINKRFGVKENEK